MATAVASRSHRHFGNFFFFGVSLFILAAVFLGFAQSYYLQGLVKLPAWKAFAAPPHPSSYTSMP